MRCVLLALTILSALALPAKADCRWEWNGNGWQQICR